MHKSVVFDCLN